MFLVCFDNNSILALMISFFCWFSQQISITTSRTIRIWVAVTEITPNWAHKNAQWNDHHNERRREKSQAVAMYYVYKQTEILLRMHFWISGKRLEVDVSNLLNLHQISIEWMMKLFKTTESNTSFHWSILFAQITDNRQLYSV
jgi:hypothetical protein